MADVFISYASEDRQRAGHLAAALEAAGWSVWWDRRLFAGQRFDLAIERELNAARSVVVLWSAASVASEWVKSEAAAALERGVLVPARIEAVDLPLEFRRRQTADLVGWDGDVAQPGFASLAEGIAATCGRPPSTNPETRPLRKLPARRTRRLLVVVAVVALGLGGYLAGQVIRPEPQSAGPSPTVQSSAYRDDIRRHLTKVQADAVDLIRQGKREQAIAVMDQNLVQIDIALRSFPDDPEFYALKGYTLKDMYQSSKGLVSSDVRRTYLSRARQSLETALQLDPMSAAAHNGMGNVLFFEGDFDAAVKEHDLALDLKGGNYPAAQHDKELVEKVRDGAIPFDF